MTRKNKKRSMRIAFISLTLLWTAFIFYNSMQTASESLKQTSIFTDIFTGLAKILYSDDIPPGVLGYIDTRLVDDIRNLAHIFEFFVLFLLAGGSFRSFDGIKQHILPAYLYGILVMLADETIQIFIDGRGFQIKDLLLDSAGLVLAYLATLLFYFLKTQRKNKKTQ